MVEIIAIIRRNRSAATKGELARMGRVLQRTSAVGFARMALETQRAIMQEVIRGSGETGLEGATVLDVRVTGFERGRGAAGEALRVLLSISLSPTTAICG